MRGVVLLSETNPLTANLFGFALNPVTQITRNYRMHAFAKYPGNMVELGSPALFGEYVETLNLQCAEKNLHLIIRDYNYADFMGLPFTWPTPGKSSLDAALREGPTQEFILVRHPIAQFESLVSHGELKRVLSPQTYLEGACRMLETYPLVAQFKYEDIFDSFNEQFPRVVEQLGLPWDPSFLSRLPRIDWITGNVEGKITQEPAKARTVDLPRAATIRELFASDPNYARLCALSGYEP